jgi:uncharacterized protein (TIGR02996 family)
MTTSTNAAGLLNAIIENPEDDFHRLVFADWCDDHGDTLQRYHAALIREMSAQPMLIVEGLHDGRSRQQGGTITPFAWQAVNAVVNRRDIPCEFSFRLGFVERIHCTLADWMRHGPRLVREHPIRRVEASGREPCHDPPTGVWYWLRCDTAGGCALASHIPSRIFCLMAVAEYASESLANDALSRAMIEWAWSV